MRRLPVYHLPEVRVELGAAVAMLRDVTVVGQKRDVEPVDSLYGNLGQSLLKQFSSYTIDFYHMRLSVGGNVK